MDGADGERAEPSVIAAQPGKDGRDVKRVQNVALFLLRLGAAAAAARMRLEPFRAGRVLDTFRAAVARRLAGEVERDDAGFVLGGAISSRVERRAQSGLGDRGNAEDGGEALMIPLISDKAVNIGDSRLFEEQMAELFHEGTQTILAHVGNELIMQAALTE